MFLSFSAFLKLDFAKENKYKGSTEPTAMPATIPRKPSIKKNTPVPITDVKGDKNKVKIEKISPFLSIG